MPLKTFQPEEPIKSSDTNDNNTFLLDQIHNSAAQLQQYLEGEIAELQGSFIQTGFIVGLPHATIPVGYLKCDGSEVLIEDYPELYAVISTIYGSSDSTSFKLPDFQGKFLRGFGGNSASIGTAQVGGVPNITGTISLVGGATSANDYSASGAFTVNTSNGTTRDSGNYTMRRAAYNMDASRLSSVYQNDLNEIRPDNMAVTWVIKY